jgi:hypothetical protein
MGRVEEARTALCARLEARRAEIEEATRARVFAVAAPAETADPEYAHGLRAAVSAAVGYGLEAIRRGEERAPPIPGVLLSQARLAARGGISLDTVLRRYLAGYTLLADFLIQESEEGGLLTASALQRLLRAQAVLFDRLLAAVSDEYRREQHGRLVSAEQRRADRVRRLLAGELLDVSDLAYDFEGVHLGMIGAGAAAAASLEELLKVIDGRLLMVRRGEGTVWAWLGSRRGFDPLQIERLASHRWPAGTSIALGEPCGGLAGWRLTHRQARAALPLARHGGLVRYVDVALIASMMRDDLLVSSLREFYLAPLAGERDGGTVARETLRAYFKAERYVTSAAALLGVNRQTISNRLRSIEARLGRPLSTCAADLDAALHLEELGASTG